MFTVTANLTEPAGGPGRRRPWPAGVTAATQGPGRRLVTPSRVEEGHGTNLASLSPAWACGIMITVQCLA